MKNQICKIILIFNWNNIVSHRGSAHRTGRFSLFQLVGTADACVEMPARVQHNLSLVCQAHNALFGLVFGRFVIRVVIGQRRVRRASAVFGQIRVNAGRRICAVFGQRRKLNGDNSTSLQSHKKLNYLQIAMDRCQSKHLLVTHYQNSKAILKQFKSHPIPTEKIINKPNCGYQYETSYFRVLI